MQWTGLRKKERNPLKFAPLCIPTAICINKCMYIHIQTYTGMYAGLFMVMSEWLVLNKKWHGRMVFHACKKRVLTVCVFN